MKETFKKWGEYVFSAKEKEDMSAAIVQNNLNVERLFNEIAQLQNAIKNAKASITSLNADSMAKSHLCRDGKESRLFDCQLVRDFEAKKRRFFTIDGGELLASEPFQEEDYAAAQLSITEELKRAEVENAEGSAEVLELTELEEKKKDPNFAAGFLAFETAKESGLEVVHSPDMPFEELAQWTEGFRWARGDFDKKEDAGEGEAMAAPGADFVRIVDTENADYLAGYKTARALGYLPPFTDIWQHCPQETKEDGEAAANWHNGFDAGRVTLQEAEEAEADAEEAGLMRAAKLDKLIDYADEAYAVVKRTGLACATVWELSEGGDEGLQVLTDVHGLTEDEIEAARDFVKLQQAKAEANAKPEKKKRPPRKDSRPSAKYRNKGKGEGDGK